MGDHDDALAEFVDGAAQQVHDLGGRVRVEVAGGLVGDDDGGATHEGAGDGDALLLAAGHLGGAVAQAIRDAQGVDDEVEPFLLGGGPGQAHGQEDVGARIQGGYQVEGLEHEADAVAAQLGERGVFQGGDVGVFDEDVPGGGGVEAGEDVHHRGFAGAGGAHDGGEFAGTEADAHVVEGAHLCVAASVDFGDTLESDDGRGRGPLVGHRGRDCCVRVHASIVRLRRASPLRRFPLIHPRDHPGSSRGLPRAASRGPISKTRT